MTVRFNVNTAKLQHGLWKNKLMVFLNGGESPPPVSHLECKLGKWISDSPQHASLPEMRSLVQQHKDFHDRIKKVIDLQNSGDTKAAWDTFQGLMEKSTELEGTIDKLGEKVA